MKITNETDKQYHQRRYKELKNARLDWLPIWEESQKLIFPGYADLQNELNNSRGSLRKPLERYSQKGKSNSFGSWCLDVVSNGMCTGLTSKTSSWFKLSNHDEVLNSNDAVNKFYEQCTEKIRSTLDASSFYRLMYECYFEFNLFGHFLLLTTIDSVKKKFNINKPPFGSYVILQNDDGIVETMYRTITMSVEDYVKHFVLTSSNDLDWSKTSAEIKRLWDKNLYGEVLNVQHGIYKKNFYGENNVNDLPFASIYWDDSNNDKNILIREDSYSINPIICPRYSSSSCSSYSVSPVQQITPELRELNSTTFDAAIALKMTVNPPLNVPSELRGSFDQFRPGMTFFTEGLSGVREITPIYQPRPVFNEIASKTEDLKRQIQQGMRSNIFIPFQNMEGVQPRNVLELTQRKEEQMQQLGPIVEQLHTQFIMPIIYNTYMALMTYGKLPEPPQELIDQSRETDGTIIENTSSIAQALGVEQASKLERFVSFVGNIAPIAPDVLQELDFSKACKFYNRKIGGTVTIFRSDEEVAEIKQRQQEAAQKQAQAEMLNTVAAPTKNLVESAQLLSETDSNSGSLAQLKESLGFI